MRAQQSGGSEGDVELFVFSPANQGDRTGGMTVDRNVVAGGVKADLVRRNFRQRTFGRQIFDYGRARQLGQTWAIRQRREPIELHSITVGRNFKGLFGRIVAAGSNEMARIKIRIDLVHIDD